MKKQRKIIGIVLLLSMMLFIVAGIVNAANMGGYAAAKEALKKTAMLKNATLKMTGDIYCDGEKVESVSNTIIKADLDKKMYSELNQYDSYVTEVYQTEDKYISSTQTEDNETQYYVTENYSDYIRENIVGIPKEIIRIMEIFTDSLSGNNKDYVDIKTVDNQKEISLNMNNEQLGEVVNEITKLMASTMSNARLGLVAENMEYTKNIDDTKWEDLGNKVMSGYITDIVISNVKANAIVNENGYLIDGNIEVLIIFTDKLGDKNNVKYVADFELTDIGTTKVELPELNDENTIIHDVSDKEDVYTKFYQSEDSQKIMDEYYEIQDQIINSYLDMSDSEKAEFHNKMDELKRMMNDVNN
jgi:hypothetical protein